MISFPNAKINLGLNVVEKRTDGFHNLETVFLPISINDALEIIPAKDKGAKLEFTFSGLPIMGNTNENLCVRAYHLLQQDFKLPAIKMHLHKTIPMGAGLGGGSADGAFTLKLLNTIFKLKLTEQQLLDYALQLGSDCPFFIKNKPCFATSRGEILEDIAIDLNAYEILLINPNIHISTSKAFSKVTPKAPEKSIKTITQQSISSWRKELVNDFEKSLSNDYLLIEHIKNLLYHNNAVYASMTGTGSTVFGIFESSIDKAIFNFPKEYQIFWTKIIA
jgi:4-diphosphocytidyl-2-C-methyl-D-erythritol kinase